MDMKNHEVTALMKCQRILMEILTCNLEDKFNLCKGIKLANVDVNRFKEAFQRITI